jgi:hypothetical protein
MPFTILDASEPVITVKISGELGKVEVSHIQAAALEVIQGCGKISALFILENFRGWKREGDWGDITFMTAHDEDIAKIAFVGEEESRDLIYAFLRRRISSSLNRIFPSYRSRKSAVLAPSQRSIILQLQVAVRSTIARKKPQLPGSIGPRSKYPTAPFDTRDCRNGSLILA